MLASRRRAPCSRTPPASTANETDLRLLLRLSRVRWLAIGMAAAYAAAGGDHGRTQWILAGGATFAAGYNGAVELLCRSRRSDARTISRMIVAGDVLWAASAAVGLSLARQYFGVVLLVVLGLCALVLARELNERDHAVRSSAASLSRYARTDHLTGLANDLALDEALRSMGDRGFGLMLVDVDGMRWTNHVYGHQAGDELLHAVAGVLANVIENSDLAARAAEDKFFVLLPDAGRERTVQLAESVRAAAHAVAVSAGRLRVSVGCAWRTLGEGPHEVMTRADDALVAAKAAGGDRVEEQMPADGPGRWRLRSTVESIVTSDRGVYSVFQRVVRLRDGATVAWEALSRPNDWPADTDVEALFLTAHRIGRARDLDWRCRQNALWEAGRLDSPLFINVHIGALIDPVHGVDQMELLCRWAGRAPESVVLELSERDGMPDLSRLQRVLADYRAAGFRFALDDLGEGQTSFEMVLAARAEFFKLARPMVQAASRDAAAYAAVRALVGFAHDIGSVVIAEGIEDVATCDLCVELDVDLGQGWLYGRPQRAERLRPR